VIAAELLDVVLSVLDVVNRDVEARKPTLEKSLLASPRRILLAEDGIVNQRVAIGFLEKWGHQVVVAENGRDAVAEVGRESFDLILMDVQMPEMNGYEATAAIRQSELGMGRHCFIVAMTAEAMKGDREKCLAAGMDDYISKPFEPEELQRVISLAPAKSMIVKSEIADKPLLDWEHLLTQTCNDEQLARKLGEVYLKESATLIGQMQTAVATNDAKRLQRSAHTLKTAASYFGAASIVESAKQLESLGANGELSDAATILASLVADSTRLVSELGEKF
jgi:two-component system, sensor histidine kinase and response regulator